KRDDRTNGAHDGTPLAADGCGGASIARASQPVQRFGDKRGQEPRLIALVLGLLHSRPMLVAQSRPRNLSWLHAGPLLFGDWGTSRLYVLGLAFYYTAHASLMYLVVMALIMTGVAWAYTIVCRCFPDGGGVDSAARQLHPPLALRGAMLLRSDFILTAGL